MIVLRTNDVRANPHAVDFIIQAAKRATDAIGFIPYGKYIELHRRGRLWSLEGDGEVLAFLGHGPFRQIVRIYQIWTREDVRRIWFATAIIAAINEEAKKAASTTISLRCANDLAANLFWRAVGFHQTDQVTGGRRRGRLINIYERAVTTNFALPFGPKRKAGQLTAASMAEKSPSVKIRSHTLAANEREPSRGHLTALPGSRL